MGLMFMIPLYLNWRILPNNKGTVTALNNIGGNCAAIIFNFLALKIVNPNNSKPTIIDKNDNNNKYFTADVANNVPFLLTILAGTYLSVGIVSIILI